MHVLTRISEVEKRPFFDKVLEVEAIVAVQCTVEAADAVTINAVSELVTIWQLPCSRRLFSQISRGIE